MRHRLFLLFLVTAFIFTKCGEPVRQEEKKHDSITTVVTKPSPTPSADVVEVKPYKRPDTIAMDHRTFIQILSFEKEVEARYSEHEEACKKWQLTADDITLILKNGKPSDDPTIHDLFSTLSCSYVGKAIIEKDTFKFEINAGAYFYLMGKDTDYVYICPAKKCQKLFLAPAYSGDVSKE